MSLLNFQDILIKAGIEPAKVQLIRHSLNDKFFKACYDADMVFEYTCHQSSNFSKGYDYWAVFISRTGTYAKFYALYRVGEHRPDTRDTRPLGMPISKDDDYRGDNAVYDLEKDSSLEEYEGKLTIDWGKGTRMWHQNGTNEKPIILIAPDKKKVFTGFESLVLMYDELKEIIDNAEVYDTWRTTLTSVYAIYLIVDTESGKQYVGSAYGKDGLFGRWSDYIKTMHGGNKSMKEIICYYPERYHAFQFSVLQILPKNLSEDEVIQIENLWKRKLLSITFGMNEN